MSNSPPPPPLQRRTSLTFSAPAMESLVQQAPDLRATAHQLTSNELFMARLRARTTGLSDAYSSLSAHQHGPATTAALHHAYPLFAFQHSSATGSAADGSPSTTLASFARRAEQQQQQRRVPPSRSLPPSMAAGPGFFLRSALHQQQQAAAATLPAVSSSSLPPLPPQRRSSTSSSRPVTRAAAVMASRATVMTRTPFIAEATTSGAASKPSAAPLRRTSPRLHKKPPPTVAVSVAAAPSSPKKRKAVNRGEEAASCSICISECDCPAAINGCDHQFCFDCIKQWSTTENSCPLCKARFTEIQQGRKKHKVTKRDQKSEASVALEGLLASLGNHPRFGRLFASRFRRGPFGNGDSSGDDDDDDDNYLPGFMNVILRTTVSTTTHHMAFGPLSGVTAAPMSVGGRTAATAIDLASLSDEDDDDDAVEVLHVSRTL